MQFGRAQVVMGAIPVLPILSKSFYSYGGLNTYFIVRLYIPQIWGNADGGKAAEAAILVFIPYS